MKNDLIKKIISIISIMFGGFILFNVGFTLFAVIVNLSDLLSGQETFLTFNSLLLLGGQIVFLLLLFVVIKRVNKDDMAKHTIYATLLTLPMMTVLVFIGILFYQYSNMIILLIGSLFVIPALVYCVYKKVPWVYTFSIIYVTLLAVYVQISGIDI